MKLTSAPGSRRCRTTSPSSHVARARVLRAPRHPRPPTAPEPGASSQTTPLALGTTGVVERQEERAQPRDLAAQAPRRKVQPAEGTLCPELDRLLEFADLPLDTRNPDESPAITGRIPEAAPGGVEEEACRRPRAPRRLTTTICRERSPLLPQDPREWFSVADRQEVVAPSVRQALHERILRVRVEDDRQLRRHVVREVVQLAPGRDRHEQTSSPPSRPPAPPRRWRCGPGRSSRRG